MEVADIEYHPVDFQNLTLRVNGSIPSNNCSGEWTPSPKLFNFIVEGIGLTTMTIFGVIGNMTSVIVLYQPKMRSSVSLLLLCLACCDILFLLTNFLNAGLKALLLVFDYFIGDAEGTEFVTLYVDSYGQYWYPLYRIALTGSVYFTVAIAIDRYVAVWWPLQSRYLCTWSRGRYAAGVVVLISLTYNGIGYLTCYLSETPTDLGISNVNMSLPGSASTMEDLNKQEILNKCISFDSALSWSYVTVMMVFPLTLLVVFNTLIYVKANKKRKLMTSQEKTETLFTVICVMVVTLFVTCNSAVVVSAFVKYFYNCNYQLWKPVLDTIDNFLVSINSSCNFLIYCAVGTRFRRQLRALLCRHKSVAVDDIDSSTDQINDRSRKQAEVPS